MQISNNFHPAFIKAMNDAARVIVNVIIRSEVERNGEDHFPGRGTASENKIIGDPVITPATINANPVFPAKVGIHDRSGCRSNNLTI
jgi:hypothetical protein